MSNFCLLNLFTFNTHDSYDFVFFFSNYPGAIVLLFACYLCCSKQSTVSGLSF